MYIELCMYVNHACICIWLRWFGIGIYEWQRIKLNLVERNLLDSPTQFNSNRFDSKSDLSYRIKIQDLIFWIGKDQLTRQGVCTQFSSRPLFICFCLFVFFFLFLGCRISHSQTSIYIRLQVLRATSALDMQRRGVHWVPRAARTATYQRCRVRTVRIQRESLALRTQEEEHDQQGQEEGQRPEGRINHTAQFAGRGQCTDYIHTIRGPRDANVLRVLQGIGMIHWLLQMLPLDTRFTGRRGRCCAHQLAGVHI